MEKIKILIIDDHKLIREAFAATLEAQPDFQVIADCPTAEKGMEMIRIERPDVVILDINLTGMNGLEATTQILSESPHTKVLGVSMHIMPAYARQMIRRGAMGYVTKSSPHREMLHAIREILAGRKYLCREINDMVTHQFLEGKNPLGKHGISALSGRETEIVDLIKKGRSSKEIASALRISVKTVEVHRYNILKKLGLPNTPALINFINRNYSEDPDL